MKKDKAWGGVLTVALILAVLAVPAGILSYALYFAWDSQLEGNNYKVALERDGRLYELQDSGSGLAFDRGTGDDHLYTSTPGFLAVMISLAYREDSVEKTDNPFFAGKIRPQKPGDYFDPQTRYLSPKDSVQIYTFYDRSRNQILSYEPETANAYVVKLRPTFPTGSKSRYSVGRRRDYLDATKLLREKLNKNLKIKTDDAAKLLILSFEN